MIRITVQTDGSVTGDVGRIMAYENQTYSEPIRILHPSYSGAVYKLVYRWGHTQFMDMLDAKDEVTIHIHGAGIVKLQFFAENPVTGEVYLASKPFELIVHKNLNVGPNTFVSSHINPCCPPNMGCSGGNNGTNELEVLMKLGIELSEEQRVRASQDSLIWEEIFNIKNKLEASLGITFEEKEPSIQNCNLLVEPGEYNLAVGSVNVPINGQAFKVEVRRFKDKVLQTAYLTQMQIGTETSLETRIYYRTGKVLVEATTDTDPEIEFINWVPMLHEGEVMEIV